MDTVFYCLEGLMKRYGIHPGNLIHVGAGKREEENTYIKLGFSKVTYIDPLLEQEEYQRIEQVHNCTVVLLKCAISVKNDKRTFYKTRFAPGSSLYQPLLHAVEEMITVECRQLKEIENGEDVLVVDAQGAEYFVLLSSQLNYDMIIVEVNTVERYRNNVSPLDVDNLMRRNNFELVASFPHGNHGMKDDVYIKVKK